MTKSLALEVGIIPNTVDEKEMGITIMIAMVMVMTVMVVIITTVIAMKVMEITVMEGVVKSMMALTVIMINMTRNGLMNHLNLETLQTVS